MSNYLQKNGLYDYVENMDILSCEYVEDFIGKNIKSSTKSNITHVAFLYKLNGVIYVLEADSYAGFVRVVPLDQYFNNYHNTGEKYKGLLSIAKLKFDLTEKERLDLLTLAKSTLGYKYDYEDAIQLWLNTTWFGKYLYKFKPNKDLKFYCSENIRYVFKKYDKDFSSDLSLEEKIYWTYFKRKKYPYPCDVVNIMCDDKKRIIF